MRLFSDRAAQGAVRRMPVVARAAQACPARALVRSLFQHPKNFAVQAGAAAPVRAARAPRAPFAFAPSDHANELSPETTRRRLQQATTLWLPLPSARSFL